MGDDSPPVPSRRVVQRRAEKPPPVPSDKPSGQAFRRQRREREAEECTAQGGSLADVPRCDNLERAHLYELQRLLAVQHEVETAGLPAPAKARILVSIAQAMAKLRTDAELERRIEQLEHERATEVADMLALRRAVDIERKRNEAERKQLDEEWARLREERQRAGLGNVA